MARARCSDEEFIVLFNQYGAAETARKLKMSSVRAIYERRALLEKKLGRQITAPPYHNTNTRHGAAKPPRCNIKVGNGVVLIGSDLHVWPGDRSTIFRAFVQFCKTYKPAAVIMNGDVMDFAQISRHPPIGWDRHPSVAEEIEYAQAMLGEIESAAFKANKIWTLGNHDGRFETRLATIAREYARLNGFHLQDYFSLWEPAWSCWINGDVVVKHRFKGGIHAPHNNTLYAGKTMVTGHLHSAKVIPFSDYNGTRYGVDSGCMADTEATAFVDYTEDNPKNWRSAFCVLTFKDGQLLPPELVMKWDADRVVFRGELIRV